MWLGDIIYTNSIIDVTPLKAFVFQIIAENMLTGL